MFGSVAELWKLLILYNRWLEVIKLYTEIQLRNLYFCDGNDFMSHITRLCLL